MRHAPHAASGLASACAVGTQRACFSTRLLLPCWTLLNTSRTTAAKRDHSVPILRLLIGLSLRKDSDVQHLKRSNASRKSKNRDSGLDDQSLDRPAMSVFAQLTARTSEFKRRWPEFRNLRWNARFEIRRWRRLQMLRFQIHDGHRPRRGRARAAAASSPSAVRVRRDRNERGGRTALSLSVSLPQLGVWQAFFFSTGSPYRGFANIPPSTLQQPERIRCFIVIILLLTTTTSTLASPSSPHSPLTSPS